MATFQIQFLSGVFAEDVQDFTIEADSLMTLNGDYQFYTNAHGVVASIPSHRVVFAKKIDETG